jgi:hypothetical protein
MLSIGTVTRSDRRVQGGEPVQEELTQLVATPPPGRAPRPSPRWSEPPGRASGDRFPPKHGRRRLRGSAHCPRQTDLSRHLSAGRPWAISTSDGDRVMPSIASSIGPPGHQGKPYRRLPMSPCPQTVGALLGPMPQSHGAHGNAGCQDQECPGEERKGTVSPAH